MQSCKAKNTGIVPSKTKKTYTAPKESLLVAVHKWTAYHNKYTYAALHKSINCYLLNILRTCQDRMKNESHVIKDLISEYYRITLWIIQKINV